MAKRHSDAIAIQLGACNPSGIALSIVEACRDIRAEPTYTGTAQITSDPAVRLMVHQLAYICGVIDGISGFPNGECWEYCLEDCREAVKIKEPT